jgi:hypothetical protein
MCWTPKIALGERLPVSVRLVVRDAETGDTVIDVDAPAMYAPGPATTSATITRWRPASSTTWPRDRQPGAALRLEAWKIAGWSQSSGKAAFDWTQRATTRASDVGCRWLASSRSRHPREPHAHHAEMLYEVRDGAAQPVALRHGARPYDDGERRDALFRVDVTDHAVNYEEKLVGRGRDADLHSGATHRSTSRSSPRSRR